MKKWASVLLSGVLLIVLVACNLKKDITEFLVVSFDGYNTAGEMIVNLDYDQLMKALYQKEYSQLTMEQKLELEEMLVGIDWDSEKTTDLSNGEVVKVSVIVPETSKKLKGGVKEFTVSGLEELTVITAKELEKKLVVNFIGASGKGEGRVDNVFDNEVQNIVFHIENTGQLKNGDQATIDVTDDLKEDLLEKGYVLEEGAKPLFEVKGLSEVAATAKEVANYEDVKRMIDEGIHRKYKDTYSEYSYGTRYEIHLEKMMYRQFHSSNDPQLLYNNENNGTLIGVYTVKEFSGGTESKLKSQKTVMYGYTNMVLDQDKKTNVANLVVVATPYDETYSLESVIQLYEGYGYTVVE